MTINGRPASGGNISLAKGDVIQTGRQSRLEIKLNDHSVLRLGSNNKLKIDPCNLFSAGVTEGVGLRLYGGKMRAIVMKLVDAKTDFEVHTGTAVVGVRGKIHEPGSDIMDFLADLIPEPGEAMAQDLAENFPTIGNRVAGVIFSVETVPKEKVTVEVQKGKVLIRSNRDSRQLLVEEGRAVESWQDGGDFEDVAITRAPE